MKFLFRTTLLAALAIAGLASCNTDDINTGTEEKDNESSMSTLLTLNLNFDGASTRAADANATTAESTVSSVSVFIYSPGGVLQTYERFTTEVEDVFSKTQTAGEGKTKIAQATVETTAGEKNIFVGVNFPATLDAALDDERMSQLSTVAREFAREEIIGLSGSGFVMSSNALINQTLKISEDGSDNVIDIDVKRLSAKVTVQEDGLVYTAKVDGGEIQEGLSFAIDNFNTKSFLLQGLAPTYVDPNWNKSVWEGGTEGKVVSSTYYGDLDEVDVDMADNDGIDDLYDYYDVNADADVSSTVIANAQYVAENTSEDMRKGALTRLIIKGTFIPDKVWVEDADNKTVPPIGYKEVNFDAAVPGAGGTAGVAQTFYRITDANGIVYYVLDDEVALGKADEGTTEEDITVAEGDGGLADELDVTTVEKYLNGVCYYDLLLNTAKSDTQYQPLRNDYYQCTISSIIALGDNTEVLDDPEEPAAVDTKIKVNVNVLHWNVVADDYVLGKD